MPEVTPTPHQLEEIRKATRGIIGVLTGAPGCGKTTVLAWLIRRITSSPGCGDIAVCAPTGKAAVRITESLQSHGLSIKAKTIHSLLGVQSAEEGGWSFVHGESQKLQQQFIFVDECFVPGTLIETPKGMKAIETFFAGDKIINASGVDEVVAVTRKECFRVIKITCGKTHLYCSENHPFFTGRGLVVAGGIKNGDSIIQTGEAVRLLRKIHYSEEAESSNEAFLQHVLLNEMVDAVRITQKESLYRREGEEVRGGKEEVSQFRLSRSKASSGTHSTTVPDGKPSVCEKNISNVEADRAQAKDSRRKRKRVDSSSKSPVRPARGRVGIGIASFIRRLLSWLSIQLQARPGKQKTESRNRMRWAHASIEGGKSKGRKEGRETGFARVDSVEVLELGHPELDRFRDAQGRLYLYDITAARHQSFSVEGLLVHNCSMIDTDLMRALLAARATGTHVLFVGDPHQLPPVGHGAPFRDMVAAGVPSGHLTEIHRNAGRIVRTCSDIRQRPFQFIVSPRLDLESGENLIVAPAKGPEQQIAELRSQIDQAAESGLDPVWDVQIVVPLNESGQLSRKHLNRELQGYLNPKGQQIQGAPFRLHDKVVCLKNSLTPAAPGCPMEEQSDDGKVYVANGEQARVVKIEPARTTVQLSSPRRLAIIPHGRRKEGQDEASTHDWDLAYAISCHKSQGSEWPVVIVMADESGGARFVCTREWVTTAISRAKRYCVVVGKQATMQGFCRRSGLWNRKTFLVERIHELEKATN